MGVSLSKTYRIFSDPDPIFVLQDETKRSYLQELPPDLQNHIASKLDETSSHNYSRSNRYIHGSLKMHLHSLKKAFENNIEMKFDIGEDHSIGFQCFAIMDESERDIIEDRCEVLHMQLEHELGLKPEDRFSILINERYYDKVGYQFNTFGFTPIHFREEKKEIDKETGEEIKSFIFNETKFKRYVKIMYTFIKQNIKEYHSLFTSSKYYFTRRHQDPFKKEGTREKEVIFRIARYDHFDDKKSEDTRKIFEKTHVKVDHEFMVVDEDRFDEDQLYSDLTYKKKEEIPNEL
jgi:hypothetical protein